MLLHLDSYCPIKMGTIWVQKRQLSARRVNAIEKPGRYRVGDNLCVKAQIVNGRLYTKYLLRYRVSGKTVERSLASTSKITLREARDKAEQLMKPLTANQIVPAEQLIKEKRAVAESARRADNATLTFREVAEEYIAGLRYLPGKTLTKTRLISAGR